MIFLPQNAAKALDIKYTITKIVLFCLFTGSYNHDENIGSTPPCLLYFLQVKNKKNFGLTESDYDEDKTTSELSDKPLLTKSMGALSYF